MNTHEWINDLDADEINAEAERAERRGELLERDGGELDEVGILIARGEAYDDSDLDLFFEKYDGEPFDDGKTDASRAIALQTKLQL